MGGEGCNAGKQEGERAALGDGSGSGVDVSDSQCVGAPVSSAGIKSCLR